MMDLYIKLSVCVPRLIPGRGFYAQISSEITSEFPGLTIYHNIHSFGQRDNAPEHLELYFYDDDPSLNHRFRRSPSLDQEVVRRLIEVLRGNPYSQTFRS